MNSSKQNRSSLLVHLGMVILGAILTTVVLFFTGLLKPPELETSDVDAFAGSNYDAVRYQKYLKLQEKNKYWADQISKGGYILHFRHAQRERWRDATAFDAYELYKNLNPLEIESSQYRATCLTRRGIEEAKLMKEVLKIAKVPVSQVISSPSCRAWMTADYAFDQTYTIENSLLNRTAMMPEQHEAFDRKLRKVLMEAEIPADKNLVLTGHGATLTYSGDIVIDEIKPDSVKDREETGLYVIERVDDRIILHYTFTSIRDLANVVIELPLE